MEPAPQQKNRGMILVPLQTIGKPSAMRSQIPLEEVDFGPRNTEMEALELTKNSRLKRKSLKKRRE